VFIWDVLPAFWMNLLLPFFKENNNQAAQLHNLETTHAVETSDFVFLAHIVTASFFGVFCSQSM
jgi:hypothetical protein